MPTSPAAPLPSPAARAHFRKPNYYAMRLVYAALGEKPRSRSALFRDLPELTTQCVQTALLRLRDAQLVLKVSGGYVRRGPARPPPEPIDSVGVGERILAFLTQPRRAREVSRHIGRSGSCTTAHLCHLTRRGHVVRLKWGVYALREHGYNTEPSGIVAATLTREAVRLAEPLALAEGSMKR